MLNVVSDQQFESTGSSFEWLTEVRELRYRPHLPPTRPTNRSADAPNTLLAGSWRTAGMNLQGALVTTQVALAVAKQMERARLPAVSSGAAAAPTDAHNGNPAALLDTV